MPIFTLDKGGGTAQAVPFEENGFKVKDWSIHLNISR